MKFIIDMNLSPNWIEVLRERGHEATHWSELGAADATDSHILDYCRAQSQILLTHDLDFGAILAFGGSSTPSVVQVREQNVDPAEIGAVVVAAVEQFKDKLERGALVTIDLRRAKARILPIN